MSPHEKRVSIYETKEQYLQLKKEWAGTKNHSAPDYSIYNILRGHPADRGFTPITKWNRLQNGAQGAFYDKVKYRLSGIIDKYGEEGFVEYLKVRYNDVINLATLRKAYVLSTIPEGQND